MCSDNIVSNNNDNIRPAMKDPLLSAPVRSDTSQSCSVTNVGVIQLPDTSNQNKF